MYLGGEGASTAMVNVISSMLVKVLLKNVNIVAKTKGIEMKENIDLFSESHVSLVDGYFMNLYGKYWVHYMSNGFFSKEMGTLTFLVLN